MKKRNAEEQGKINRVQGLVKSLLAQKLPDVGILTTARNKLSELVVAAKSMESRNGAGGIELSKEFEHGLDSTLLALRSFRSGYASNDASQAVDPNGTPSTAPINTVKSALGFAASGEPSAPGKGEKRVGIVEFVNYAAGVFKRLGDQELPEQLASLRTLERVVAKANEEDFSDVLIPTDNDPDKQKADVTEGSIATAAGGTSAPQTASSNFATNSNVSASNSAPATGQNTSTGDVVAIAGQGTQGTGGDNFSAGGQPSASNTGPASPTNNVTTAAGGAGETGTGGENNFSGNGVPAPVAKSDKGGEAAGDPLDEAEQSINKSASDSFEWPRDLNSPDFRADNDFGRGNDWDFFGPYRGPKKTEKKAK